MAQDVNKRIAKNPFYETFTKMLGRSGFKSHWAESGPSGSVDLHVFVRDLSGKETVKKFNLPAKLGDLGNVEWKHQYQRMIDAMEKGGFTPSQTRKEAELEQLVVLEPGKVIKPQLPSFGSAGKLFLGLEDDEPENLVMPPSGQKPVSVAGVESTMMKWAIEKLAPDLKPEPVPPPVVRPAKIKEPPRYTKPVLKAPEPKPEPVYVAPPPEAIPAPAPASAPPMMQAQLNVKLSTLLTLSHLYDKFHILDDPDLTINLGITITDLSSFVQAIHESNAELVNMVPMKSLPASMKA